MLRLNLSNNWYRTNQQLQDRQEWFKTRMRKRELVQIIQDQVRLPKTENKAIADNRILKRIYKPKNQLMIFT
jgi:hypothetical protein